MHTRNCIPLTAPHGRSVGDFIADNARSRSSHSQVQGKRLKWEISTGTLKGTPPWMNRETNPPPLSPDKAIAISRQEVPKYFPDAEAWQVETIELQTLGLDDRWYYVVEWRLGDAVGDGLAIPVLMSGVAVPLTPDAE